MSAIKSFATGILLTGALFVLSSPAFCADEKKKEAETPVTRLEDATKTMTEGLEKNELLQFQAIETSYRTIRAVENVQMSVSRAVRSCGKENPDIRNEMDDRLSSWMAALRPTMKDARSKMDKMILLQGFTQPSRVRNYLKMFDAAILYRNEGIKAVPVTEKDDCLKLKETMDKTQVDLVNLVRETLALDAPIKTADAP